MWPRCRDPRNFSEFSTDWRWRCRLVKRLTDNAARLKIHKIHTTHCTLHTALYTLHTTHCTLHTAHCSLHATHCSLLTAHLTLNSEHCRLHITHWTLEIFNVYWTLYTVNCTLHIRPITLKTENFKQHTEPFPFFCIAKCVVFSLDYSKIWLKLESYVFVASEADGLWNNYLNIDISRAGSQ